MNQKIINSQNKTDTMKLAKSLARQLSSGEVICLKGDLGAGKTVFTKALARGLGIKELITSPTFVLMREYDISAKRKLYHIDCYRLNNSQELLDLGFKKWLKNDNIIVIEWGDKVRDILPKGCIWIKFEVLGENKRRIKMIF